MMLLSDKGGFSRRAADVRNGSKADFPLRPHPRSRNSSSNRRSAMARRIAGVASAAEQG